MENVKTTHKPNRNITKEMQSRINDGHLDYREDIGWHDPRGYNPELRVRVKQVERY